MIRLAARGIRAVWEPACGHLPELVIGGAPVLHAAPWREELAVQADENLPLVDRRLGGTFACAPFGQDDLDHGPPHGRSANGGWQTLRAGPSALTARCRVGRGRLEARIALRDDHPVLYQTHVLDLEAPTTFAHHPMFRITGGGRLAASHPRAILTWQAEAPVYAPDQRSTDWTLATPEGPRDLREIPTERCEDFVAMVSDAPGLDWTALRRHAEGDTILLLRRAEQLPVTMLWLTNGARQASPWGGRFRGVIGIEDAICAGAEGMAAAVSGRNRVASEGVPTALSPGRYVIPHAIVRLPRALDVHDVRVTDALQVTTADGSLTVPFDGGHFA